MTHFHTNEQGIIVRCYHTCKAVVRTWQFWLGMTLGFPLEHWLWEKVWGFRHITEWMGL